jgi:HD-GYP domain-containing protein (c-di-GMP phosphodiesterase class II)
MTFRPGRLVIFCGLLPTLAIALLSLTRPAFLRGLEYGTYDVLLRAAKTSPPTDRIVIVDIDDRSLTTVGQWPWRRDVLGQLIDRLRQSGAATVALDIIFAEPDRYDGGDRSPDDALADTLRAGRVVLGYALTFDGATHSPRDCVRHQLGLGVIRVSDDPAEDPLFRATGAICNLPVLTDAAGASGFLNAAPDPDGLLRRVPLVMELEGRSYPGLALAAISQVAATRPVALRVINANMSSLVLDNRSVPLDGKSNLLLRFRGPKRAFPYVSAVDVLRGQADGRKFKDKIVFVGTTALGTREVVSTPLDTLFAGVEVQATVADNLLQQDYIRRPEYGVAIETQLVIGLGLIAAFLVRRFGLASGALGVAFCAVVAWAGSARLMSDTGIFLSPLFPTIGLTGALAAITVARFTIERRRADEADVENETSQKLMVQALLSLTEVRDAETGRHSRRTQQYTRVLAEQLARHPRFRDYLTTERIDLLSSLAPLHDIGKVGVPDRLLNKPGQLTAEELAEMQKHPVYGRDVILHAQERVGVHDHVILGMAKDIVYTHHEKWDGTGYPEGLRENDIPIPGRVISVVDVYDASTTRTLYRSPLTHDQAVALIMKGRGSHFDPDVVDAFVRVSPIIQRFSADRDHGSGSETSSNGSR